MVEMNGTNFYEGRSVKEDMNFLLYICVLDYSTISGAELRKLAYTLGVHSSRLICIGGMYSTACFGYVGC